MYQGWQEEYKGKLMSAEDAAKMIKSGDRVHVPLATTPGALIDALQAPAVSDSIRASLQI